MDKRAEKPDFCADQGPRMVQTALDKNEAVADL